MSFESSRATDVYSIVAAGAVLAECTVHVPVIVAALTGLALKRGVGVRALGCVVTASACRALVPLEYFPVTVVARRTHRAVFQVVLTLGGDRLREV